MIVALLHPGQMGAAIGAQLTDQGHRVLWNPHGRSADTRERADTARLHPVQDLAALVRQVEVVLSICPAAAAESVAASVAAVGYRGLYVDANAVSPQRMRAISDLFAGTDATVVDACISGAPPSDKALPRIYIAGPSTVGTAESLFTSSGFDTTVLGPQIGAASALKMATASWMRTARASVAIAHALADEYGVTDELQREALHFGVPMLADRDYLSGVAARAWRWTPEMQEIAATLAEAGLPTDIAEATGALYQRLTSAKNNWDISPAEVLDMLKDDPHP